MSKVTKDMVAELHTQKEAIKSKIDQAKGKLSAIEAQMQEQLAVLKAHGVTPETAERRIADMDDNISKTYDEAKAILEVLNDTHGEG